MDAKTILRSYAGSPLPPHSTYITESQIQPVTFCYRSPPPLSGQTRIVIVQRDYLDQFLKALQRSDTYVHTDSMSDIRLGYLGHLGETHFILDPYRDRDDAILQGSWASCFAAFNIASNGIIVSAVSTIKVRQ